MLWFIAIRYLVTHTRQSIVCILGVTISVVMFLVMSAMMRGLTDKFIIETVESSGHITVHDEPRQTRTPILERVYGETNAVLAIEGTKPRENVKSIKNANALAGSIRRMPGVLEAAQQVFGDAVATYGTKTFSMQIYGVEPSQFVKVTTIGDNVKFGSFLRLKTTADGIVLGRGIADTLGVSVDDNLAVTSSAGGHTIAKVVGIFDTGVTPVDYSRAYMLLSDAQTLLDKKNVISGIVIRTADYTTARDLATQIETVAGYKVESWQESNANFLKIFSIQTIITYFITAALLIVAAFGVLNILIMAVLERVNDIAILKSFGLSRGDITWIYLIQGIVIGVIGASFGLAFGKLGIEGLRRLPIQLEGLVKSDGLLMSEHRENYIIAFVMSVLITMLAAVYPARRAATYDPVEVIRGAH